MGGVVTTCSKWDLEWAVWSPPVRNGIWNGWCGRRLFEMGFEMGGVVATCLK
jgi:hypothetical protein